MTRKQMESFVLVTLGEIARIHAALVFIQAGQLSNALASAAPESRYESLATFEQEVEKMGRKKAEELVRAVFGKQARKTARARVKVPSS